MQILQHELEYRKSQTDEKRARIEKDGFDPLDPNAAQQIDLPVRDTLTWIERNPKMVDTIMDDPDQRDRLLGNVWSEVFNHDGNIAYLNLIKEMTLRAEMDEQQAEPLNALIQRLRESDSAALEEMKLDGQLQTT